jgi:hypothetical protein
MTPLAAHRLHDFVVQQPGGVVVHSQMTAQFEGGDAGFGLADQIEY